MSGSSRSAAGQKFISNGTIHLHPQAQIDLSNAGLRSVEGAQVVLKMIALRQAVTRLLLGSNALGDDGTITVFEYLGSDIGKKYKIMEISLNSNGIGDSGLLAVAKYLDDNSHLKALFLQNNNFAGSPSIAQALASAINSSVLERISLATNRGLADSFVEKFLPKLDSPTLREIHLSAMNLTSRSTPHIVDYISSPRCRLRTFKCNGNSLGYRSVGRIIRALERANFWLLRIELYSNQLTISEASEDEDARGQEAWKESEKLLNHLILRNDYLKAETETQALRLLRFSRALLLRPSKANQMVNEPQTHANNSCLCMPSLDDTHSTVVTSFFPFLSLPVELQLNILSFLAPFLSSAQRVRVYTYACSPSTLPPLLALPNTPWGRWSEEQKERDKWLDKVGCCVFEPDGVDKIPFLPLQ